MEVSIDVLEAIRKDLLRFAAHRVIQEDLALCGRVKRTIGQLENLILAKQHVATSPHWALSYSIGFAEMGFLPN